MVGQVKRYWPKMGQWKGKSKYRKPPCKYGRQAPCKYRIESRPKTSSTPQLNLPPSSAILW